MVLFRLSIHHSDMDGYEETPYIFSETTRHIFDTVIEKVGIIVAHIQTYEVAFAKAKISSEPDITAYRVMSVSFFKGIKKFHFVRSCDSE